MNNHMSLEVTTYNIDVRKKILKVIVFLFILIFSSWHEYVSYKISEPGYYKGTILNKTLSGVRSQTHYFYVQWDGYGADTVVVHPMEYKRFNIGQRFETHYGYFPLVGATGMVYNPDTNEYSMIFGLLGFFSKLGVVIFIVNYYRSKKQNVINQAKNINEQRVQR